MKIILNKKQLEKIIEKHYAEELDFQGKATINAYDHDDYRGGYTEVEATLKGKLRMDGEELVAKYELNETEIKEVLKRYFEKAGYKYVTAFMTSKTQHYDTFERDEGILTFDNVEVEVKEKVKEKVVKIE